jgi:1-pyrroline-5-carboxylate dehydrogenase
MYVPESLWPQVKEGLIEVQKSLKMGDVQEYDTFMSAVIDKKAFDRVSGYIKDAKAGPNTKIVVGGGFDDSVGYFIEPTVVETSTPTDKIFREELFGPVVTAFVYKDADTKKVLHQVGVDTPFALTGAIYSQDQ